MGPVKIARIRCSAGKEWWMNISGQAAVVTGGASGLGAAVAQHLSSSGAKVALLDIDATAAGEVASKIGGLSFSCDVSDEDDVGHALAEARDQHGPARICVNCAGVGSAVRIVGRRGLMPLDHFKRELEINLVGTFNVMRLAVAEMSTLEPLEETRERGIVVNTASIAAYEGQIGQAPYAASKAGIVGLTLEAAREFGSMGVRVMTVAPGLFTTPMWEGTPDEVYDNLKAQMVFPKRMGHPEEFARLVGHIVENTMLNGEVIRLDGAVRMQAR